MIDWKMINVFFLLLFQLPVADPFLEKVNLSDLGEYQNLSIHEEIIK